MKLTTSFIIYQQLHTLLDQAKTGNPNQISITLGVSVSCLYAIKNKLNKNRCLWRIGIRLINYRKIKQFYLKKLNNNLILIEKNMFSFQCTNF